MLMAGMWRVFILVIRRYTAPLPSRYAAEGAWYRLSDCSGVSTYAAAAASLGIELTVPKVTQTLILTRTAMKSSAMPPGEG